MDVSVTSKCWRLTSQQNLYEQMDQKPKACYAPLIIEAEPLDQHACESQHDLMISDLQPIVTNMVLS